ncbi:hypothetical protein SVAN01_10468 [Stagonosporopsis vannaccii]|nr:hypothetical protein SVAN01_10468 [Stagonosporopsis vannaccii]
MRLSVHFREPTAPVGQARTHPAICNPSHPFPNLTGQPPRLQPGPSRQGAPPIAAQAESVDRCTGEVVVHAAEKQDLWLRVGGTSRMASADLQCICSKPASAMIASGASGRISLSTVPLTVRTVPSSRSEPGPLRACYPGLVQRDLRAKILMAFVLPVLGN